MTKYGRLVSVAGYAAAAVLIMAMYMPPVMDFPNHLSRIWLLGGAAAIKPMSYFYEVRWAQASTNIGVDYVASWLAHTVPIMLVSKFLLFIVFLGPAISAALLQRRLFGAFDAWNMLFLLLAWTTTSVAGFMSYQFGIAGALLAAAIMAGVAERGRLVGMIGPHLVVCAVLLLVHPFGALFYLILFVSLAIGWAPWTKMRRDWLIRARFILAAVVLAALPVALLFVAAPHPPRGVTAIDWPVFRPGAMLNTILSPVLSYSRPVDIAFAAGMMALIIGGFATRRLRCHGGLLIGAIVIGLLSLVAPATVGDASWLDRRLPLMAAFMVLVALHPAPRSDREQGIFIAGPFVLAALRVGWIATIWIPRDQDARMLVEASRVIPAGSTVLLLRNPTATAGEAPAGRIVVGDPYGPEPTSRHFGALLVPARQVFVPTLFTIPGQHALSVRPAWRAYATQGSNVPQPAELGRSSKGDPYLADWDCRFEYVVLTDEDQSHRQALPSNVTIVARTSFATIGKIARRGCHSI